MVFEKHSHLGPVEFTAVVICLLYPLSQFLLHLRPSSKEDVVDKGIFQQSQEDEHKAAHQVHVDGFDVGDLGQRLSEVRVDGCHCEHSGDPWKGNNDQLHLKKLKVTFKGSC